MTARGLGLQLETRYDRAGSPREAVRGPGWTALQCGNAVLSLALLVAFLQGLLRLSESRAWLDLAILLGTLAAGAIAVPLSLTADWRRWYVTATVALAAVGFLQLNLLIDLNGWQKLEIFCVAVGVVALTASHVGRFREEEQADDSVSLGLWLGSLFTVVPLFIAMLHYRFFTDAPSLWDELGLLTATILLVVSGCSWQIRATTLLGGSGLVLYLLILVGSLAYRPEVAIGVYLLVGGGVIFLSGVLLSVYRDRLMALPEMIARREGIFRIIGWR